MRSDVSNQIKLIREDVDLLNKSELARRFNCDRRTVDKYISYLRLIYNDHNWSALLQPLNSGYTSQIPLDSLF